MSENSKNSNEKEKAPQKSFADRLANSMVKNLDAGPKMPEEELAKKREKQHRMVAALEAIDHEPYGEPDDEPG